MELIVNGKKINDPVSNRLITDSIYTLTEKSKSFILSKNEVEYMRSSGTATTGFVLEYYDGSLDGHFKCANTNLSTEQVAGAFKNYFAQNDKWKTNLSWEKASLSPLAGKSSGKIVNILSGLALAGYLIWKYFFSS